MTKKAICRIKNSEGEYIPVHLQTEASVVLFNDGENLEQKLENIQVSADSFIDDANTQTNKTWSSDKIAMQLLNKSDVAHNHTVAEVNGLTELLSTYLTDEDLNLINQALAQKSNVGHEHGLDKINDWKTHLYNKNEVNDLLNALSLGFTWKAPVNSVEELETLGTAELGWATIVDGDKLYVYSEDGWIDLGSSSLPPLASEEHDGLMAKEDKKKLNSIDTEKLAQLDLNALTQSIQENASLIAMVISKLGDLSALTTTEKTSLVLAINELVSNKAEVSHTHEITTIEGLQAHLETRYTKEEVDSLLASLNLTTVTDKIAVNTKAIEELSTSLTGLDDYVKALEIITINDNGTSASATWSSAYIYEYVSGEILKKANVSHAHTISDITNLQTALSERYTKAEVDNLLSTLDFSEISGKIDVNTESIESIVESLTNYYTKSEVDNKFSTYTPDIPTATSSTDGLMSAGDKTKLNSLDLGEFDRINTALDEANVSLSTANKSIESLNLGLSSATENITSLETQIGTINESISSIDLNAPRIYAQAEAPTNPIAGTIWVKIEG